MILWGFNVSAIKVLVTNIEPVLLTSFRIFVAGISVCVICYFMRIFRMPKRKELFIILIISLFNVVAHHMLIALGLNNTSAVNSGLILGMGPLLTMMAAIIYLNKQIILVKVIGFLLGFAGVIVTTLSGTAGITLLSSGDLLIFIGVLTQAISFIQISKLNPELDPRLLTGFMLVIGGIIIFLLSFYNGSNVGQILQLFSWKLGLIFLFSALCATAFGHMVYNVAIKKVGPAETAIFINFSTIFALLGAILFLGEKISVNHIFGLILISLGVLIGSGSLEYIRDRKINQSKSV